MPAGTLLPGSFADCMPVWNEAKDLCLLFSSELLRRKGAMMLKCRLRRKLREHLPEEFVDRLVTLRNKWNAFRYGSRQALTGPGTFCI